MTNFDIAFLTVYLVLTAAGFIFIAYILRTAVRPRPHDAGAVDRLIARARRHREIVAASPQVDEDGRVHLDRSPAKRPRPERALAEIDVNSTPPKFDLDAAAAALNDVCRRFNVELRGTPSGVEIVPKQ
ncbi:MAG: hypothetical protein WA957_00230 [Alteraurantiacibacter sp.]